MNFKVVKVWREERFSVGIETTTNTAYLDIPVSNRMVDYLEYYAIPREWVEHPDDHLDEIRAFAARAKKQKPPPEGEDDKLLQKPGADRGVA